MSKIEPGPAIGEPVTAGLDPAQHQVVSIGPSGVPARMVMLLGRFRNHFANLTAFTILQAASYLIPVVTIPYFARVLGIAGMGRLAIAGAVALAAGVLMDYAIQLSGTRFAAAHVDDPLAINRYLDASSAVKLGILSPILVALGVAGIFIPSVTAHFWIFFWSLASTAMMGLFPQWLFQGLMIMPLAARILVTCRVGAAVTAMLLVRSPADAFVVPMAQAIGGGIGLVAAASMLGRRFGIVVRRPAREDMRTLLRDNRQLFGATAWGAIYAHGAVIIMSTMLSATSIGFYSIAQKISQAFVSMFNVAAQTGFPVLVRTHDRDPSSFRRRVAIYMAVVVTVAASALAVLFLVRQPTYLFFAGQMSEVGIKIFSLWLAASLFTIASVSLNPVMVVLRLDGQMARVYRYAGLTFLVAAPIACTYFGVVGMAGAILVTEAFMALFCTAAVAGGLRAIKRSTVAT